MTKNVPSDFVSELNSYFSLQVVTHFMTTILSLLTSVLMSTSLATHIHSNILEYKVGVLCYAQISMAYRTVNDVFCGSISP